MPCSPIKYASTRTHGRREAHSVVEDGRIRGRTLLGRRDSLLLLVVRASEPPGLQRFRWAGLSRWPNGASDLEDTWVFAKVAVRA